MCPCTSPYHIYIYITHIYHIYTSHIYITYIYHIYISHIYITYIYGPMSLRVSMPATNPRAHVLRTHVLRTQVPRGISRARAQPPIEKNRKKKTYTHTQDPCPEDPCPYACRCPPRTHPQEPSARTAWTKPSTTLNLTSLLWKKEKKEKRKKEKKPHPQCAQLP